MKKTDYLLPFIMKISLSCLNYSIFDYWSLQKNGCWFSDDITPDTVTGINPKPTTNNLQPPLTASRCQDSCATQRERQGLPSEYSLSWLR